VHQALDRVRQFDGLAVIAWLFSTSEQFKLIVPFAPNFQISIIKLVIDFK
jgi:hypothetical protein